MEVAPSEYSDERCGIVLHNNYGAGVRDVAFLQTLLRAQEDLQGRGFKDNIVTARKIDDYSEPDYAITIEAQNHDVFGFLYQAILNESTLNPDLLPRLFDYMDKKDKLVLANFCDLYFDNNPDAVKGIPHLHKLYKDHAEPFLKNERMESIALECLTEERFYAPAPPTQTKPTAHYQASALGALNTLWRC